MIFILDSCDNCCDSFALYWVDKVTNGTWSFVSVILNIAAWFEAALHIAQLLDQVSMRLASELMNHILRFLQKLLKYFNGAIIWRAFIPKLPVEPVTSSLYLNKALSPGKKSGTPALVKSGSSL